ncbi:putative Exopolysaccharide biosynthesis/transport protein [Bradyrhizobium sp. STM 3843]|uniref:CpsD/CapB family tyrosine-protein kinase n=1 Tax=unclassified Bradyrhizobium TaxID=2631580 RepID=UPI0002404FCB|nr:CpsD/CapB family tyrosine-protein kinase [Bradyrhizobium sp. STM 3843]CCE09358.1 putative Exopolysaccharide biosynthesis/transport protein [Bradyrhizobium sp. STM 3843]
MESIRQAVERAKLSAESHGVGASDVYRRHPLTDISPFRSASLSSVELNAAHLQKHRILAHDGKDVAARPFDLLRAEVLRSMDLKGWRILAVTSPTPSCGKTFTALNLAMSIARQADREVCLVDLDFRRPQIATSLGLKSGHGVTSVLEGRSELHNAMVQVRIGSTRLEVMPTTTSVNSSDLSSSLALKKLLQDVAGYERSRITIVDLPPMLAGHDVISILPQIDCVLLVAAVGTTKTSEIEDCKKYLENSDIVRVVLNKVPQSNNTFAYY